MARKAPAKAAGEETAPKRTIGSMVGDVKKSKDVALLKKSAGGLMSLAKSGAKFTKKATAKALFGTEEHDDDEGGDGDGDSSSSSGSDDSDGDSDEDSDEDSDDEEDFDLDNVGLINALLSLVPYTKPWREARNAIKNLDDVKAMQMEVARCKVIKEILRDDHNTALAELLTDNGCRESFGDQLSMFNNTKLKMEKDGLWKWEHPEKRRRRELAEQQRVDAASRQKKMKKRGKLKHMFQQKQDIAEAKKDVESEDADGAAAQKKPAGETAAPSAAAKDAQKQSSCKWKGEDDTGKPYICSADRLTHPFHTRKDEYGAEVAEILSTCAFHAVHCVGQHGGKLVKIKIPNSSALCNECFVQQHKKAPARVAKLRIPGVQRAPSSKHAGKIAALMSASLNIEESKDQLSEHSVCNWRPNPRVQQERGHRCTNHVFRNPQTMKLEKKCAWHLPQCTMPHPTPSKILVPNDEGLCMAHFAAAHGHPPNPRPFPPPGVLLKNSHKPEVMEVKKGPKAHSMAPTWPPPHVEPPEEFFEKPPPSDIVDRIVAFLEAQKFKKKKVLLGGKAALTIQRMCRGFAARLLRKRLTAHRVVRARISATLLLQPVVRGYTGRRRAYHKRVRDTKAVEKIQPLIRGHICRRNLKRDLAARTLQRAGTQMLTNAMVAAVRLKIQQMRKIRRMDRGAVHLQRHFRGIIGRRRAQQCREEAYRVDHSARLVQRLSRGVLGRRRFQRAKNIRDMQIRLCIVLQACLRGLRQRLTYARMKIAYFASTTSLQRCIRGHLGRCRANRERARIEQAWGWFRPTQDRKIFDGYLPRSHYGVQPPLHLDNADDQDNAAVIDDLLKSIAFAKRQDRKARAEEKRRAETAGTADGSSSVGEVSQCSSDEGGVQCSQLGDHSLVYFEEHDPDKTGYITKDEFRHSLQQLWPAPLLDSEVWSLMQHFDTVHDGSVDYIAFLRFAKRQLRPCPRHERLACMDCTTRGGCIRHRCGCAKFRKQKYPGSAHICECGHYAFVHMIEPLPRQDVMYNKDSPKIVNKRQMKAILAHRSNDGEIPQGINGVGIEAAMAHTNYDLQIARGQAKTVAEFTGRQQAPVSDINQVIAVATKDRDFDLRLSFQPDWKETALPGDVLFPRDGFRKGALYSDQEMFERHAVSQIKMQPLEQSATMTTYVDSMRTCKEENIVLLAQNPKRFSKKGQSKDELEKGFTISNPVPVISGQELRLTTEPSSLYLDLLLPLCDEKLGLVEDRDLFIKFVFNVIVFMERHWRKMVRDMRTGTINKRLPISPTERARIEATMLPNPPRARMFEEALRDLGFHNRASGVVYMEDKKAAKLSRPKSRAKTPKTPPAGVTTAISAFEMTGGSEGLRSPPPHSRGGKFFLRSRGSPTATDGQSASIVRDWSIQSRGAMGVGDWGLPSRGSTTSRGSPSRRTMPPIAEIADESARVFGDEDPFPPRTIETRQQASRKFKRRVSSPDLTSALFSAKTRTLTEALASQSLLLPQGMDASSGPSSPLRKFGSAGGGVDGPSPPAPPSPGGKALGMHGKTLVLGQVQSSLDHLMMDADMDRTAVSRRAQVRQLQVRLDKRRAHEEMDTEADRPVTQEELFEVAQQLTKMPRTKSAPVLQMDRNRRKFVCGHPGCGHAFSSRELCLKHQHKHELRQRLAIATPNVDQHLLSYWPPDVPWKKADQLARYDKTGVPFLCPIEGCTKNFSSRDRLDRHVRLGHTREDLEKAFPELKPKPKDRNVHWTGTYKLVPPFPCPQGAELPICEYHARHNTRCPVCADVQARVQRGSPKPPLQYYEEVKLGVRTADGVVDIHFGLKAGTQERTPYIIDHMTGQVRHIQLIAMCQDHDGNNWMACSVYWSYSDLKDKGFDFNSLESPLDKENELMEAAEVIYMPIVRIKGNCFTLFCSKDEFHRRKKGNALPSGRVKFARYRYNSETNRCLGTRVVQDVPDHAKSALDRANVMSLAPRQQPKNPFEG